MIQLWHARHLRRDRGPPQARGAHLSRAEAAAHKALELDETLADAHASLAMTHMLYEWDWGGRRARVPALPTLDGALGRAVSPLAYLARALAATGRSDEALSEARKTLEWLERAARAREPLLIAVGTPFLPFESVRETARFETLLEEIGIPS